MGQIVKCIVCIRRSPELSVEEFEAYWRDNHAELVRSVAPTVKIRRYVQSHTIRGGVTEGLSRSRGGIEPFDGVAEVWFDVDDLTGDMTDDQIQAHRAMSKDERNFIDMERSAFFFTTEHEFVSPAG